MSRYFSRGSSKRAIVWTDSESETPPSKQPRQELPLAAADATDGEETDSLLAEVSRMDYRWTVSTSQRDDGGSARPLAARGRATASGGASQASSLPSRGPPSCDPQAPSEDNEVGGCTPGSPRPRSNRTGVRFGVVDKADETSRGADRAFGVQTDTSQDDTSLRRSGRVCKRGSSRGSSREADWLSRLHQPLTTATPVPTRPRSFRPFNATPGLR
jgi:hypothetical protein